MDNSLYDETHINVANTWQMSGRIKFNTVFTMKNCIESII